MLFDNPRHAPSIPQRASEHQLAKRDKQLRKAQQHYVWNDQVPNVEGVPMSDGLPPDSTPTIEWLLKLTDAVLEILENKILNFVDDDIEEAERIASNLKRVQRSHRLLQSNLKIPFIDKILTRIRAVLFNDIEAITKEVESLIGVLQRYPDQNAAEVNDLKSYRDLFESIKLDPRAEKFYTDEMFAFYRVAGPNPMLLTNISSLPDKLAVDNEGYKKVMGEGDSLKKALKDKRLFVLDYAELQPLVDNPGEYKGMDKHLYAPIALFARKKGEDALIPVAIQRTQEKDERNVVYRSTATDGLDHWRWQTAKSQLEMAEGNYHELYVHLARTHLVIEAFAVATHRHLSEYHPVNILLLPHYEGTFFINNAAATSLIIKGGPIDQLFAAEISTSQQAAGSDRLAFDFYQSMLPNNLNSRGVMSEDVLPFYPYRDDAMLVWEAIHNWVSEYLDLYYRSDEEVITDGELASWTQDIMTNGQVKGFTSITSKSQLSDVLTMIIFTASAQHAAVNFPQSPMMTYAPAISGALWGPEGAVGDTETAWLQTMAPLKLAELQLAVLHLLGAIHYRPLGEYKSNDFPYTDWFKDKKVTGRKGPLKRFRQALTDVESIIDERNKSRKHPYGFLKPSRIPMSINI